jgi:hypothetical protein
MVRRSALGTTFYGFFLFIMVVAIILVGVYPTAP